MLRSRNFGRFCAIVTALSFLLTGAFVYASQSGLIEKASAEGYSKRLFEPSRVHSIDIVMDDWDGFIENCTDEEYVSCTVLIDGEKYSNVAIRAKGNTSLSSVQQYGNDRYSLKLEFDHYDSTQTYYGLDKLCLNNLIQDKTMMKDYLAYTLMNRMGVASPECSYVWITVNGSDWGLYLAVEGVEDAFLDRNYGADAGNLYKPDSQSNGGGRGNGRDFDFANFDFDSAEKPEEADSGAGFGETPNSANFGFDSEKKEDFSERSNRDFSDQPGGFSFGGMGSSDVKLQYIDDDPSSYSNIFDSVKTKIDSDDQARLIESLKALSEGDASVVNTDSVMRYLAVHDFLVNGDSYTGGMVHNYYLYEKDGVLEMIPWDYNLAFGAFSSTSASDAVNSPIDSPVSGGDVSDRPMVAWIFENETYLEAYHAIYAEFVENNLANGWLSAEIERVYQMIRPYAEKDPTAFYTAEELDQAVQTLQTFCEKRAESVQGQLGGTIPSTEAGQTENAANLIDAGDVNLNDMGEFNQGGKGGMQTPPDGDFDEKTSPNMPNGAMPNMQNGGFKGETQANGDETDEGETLNTPTGDTQTINEATAAPNGDEAVANGMPNKPSSDAIAANGMPSAPNGDAATANGMPSAPSSDAATASGMPSAPSGDAATASGMPSAPSGDAATANGMPSSDANMDSDGETSENSESQLEEARRDEKMNFQPPVQNSDANQNSEWEMPLLLGVSIVALIAGLVFAKKYKNGR